jgi:probable phosphoglycerate mutase
MKSLYIVSHTESEHHLQDIVGGWFDSDLTPKGVEDAKKIANTLALDQSIQTIFSSDLKRAKSTADAIAIKTQAGITVSKALREMSFGDAEGKPQAWLDERIHPEDGDNRLDHRIVTGAETKREFAGRIYDFMESQSFTGSSVISTHAFAATFIIAWWIKMPLESIGYVNFGIQPGKITKLEEDDFFKNRGIRYLNQPVQAMS